MSVRFAFLGSFQRAVLEEKEVTIGGGFFCGEN
jgi:hypothetical protein